MLGLGAATRVYVATGATDMRLGGCDMKLIQRLFDMEVFMK
jgi:hypothetical protein